MDEEQRQKTLAQRTANQELAVKVEHGTDYHEPVEVYFLEDKKKHTVDVYAVSMAQFYDAVAKSHIESTGATLNFKDNASVAVQLLPIATRDPDILKKLMFNEDGKLMAKVLELSRPPKN